MSPREVKPSVVEGIQLPSIVRLDHNLYGAPFVLMKLLPARYLLDRARDEGVLKEGSVVIETSSGTFGLGLAILCNLRGYKLILVSDPAIEPPLQRRLEELGARVEICREPLAVGGYQGARLKRMAQLRAENPGHFWPCQYDNAHNPEAYAAFAELLAETLGEVHCLVGTVGSGGSMCGTTRYLRLMNPGTRAVGVDTHGSVLFGQPDQGKRLLRGLGNSLMPKNLDHTAFDDVHWVSAAEGFGATRALHRRHALYMGPTSGAAHLVAEWYARQHPEWNVVAILPDEGYRYQDNVYDDAWLQKNGALQKNLPIVPGEVATPLEAGPHWSWMRWNRRTYEQVMGRPFHQEMPA